MDNIESHTMMSDQFDDTANRPSERAKVDSSRPRRVEETGRINLLSLGTVIIRFERYPVWLLFISTEMVEFIIIDQFRSFSELDAYIKNNNIDSQLYTSLVLHLGLSKFKFGPTDVNEAKVCLVSGSIRYLNDQSRSLRNRRFVFLTETHTTCRRLPSIPGCHRFEHYKLGGGTNYSGLICSHPSIDRIPHSQLRRSINDYLDHSVRPSAIKPDSFLTSNHLLPIQHVSTTIEYRTSFTSTGLGYRSLSKKEIAACFGYPSSGRRYKFTTESFPIVPAVIGELTLQLYFSASNRKSNQTRKPRPLPLEFVEDSRGTYLPTLNKFLPHLWSQDATTTVASTKSDTAQAEEKLWNLRILPLFQQAEVGHLDTLRRFLMRIACKRFVQSYFRFLRSNFGRLYSTYLENRGASRHNRGGTSVSFSDLRPLLKELKAGRLVIRMYVGEKQETTFSNWTNGSRLIHWRWCQVTASRDGFKPYVWDKFPNSLKPVKAPAKRHITLIYEKIIEYLKRGYLVPENENEVKNCIDYFAAPKGEDDIRLVFNGTSCGLNDSVWSSNFWLPTSKTMTRLLSYGYEVVDLDIGEMFLNFPLHESLVPYSGMDLSPFRKEITRDFPELKEWLAKKRLLTTWTRCWFGFTGSPELSARHYYLAEEFVRGDRLATNNPLRWDSVVLNLIGAEDYNPALANVFKWDKIFKRPAGDLISYVDDLRAIGFSLEEAWRIARWVASKLQYLGIQDASRKRRIDNGPWAGGVYRTTNGNISKSVTQPKWDKARGIVMKHYKQVVLQEKPEVSYKELERERGFLCHLGLVFEIIMPFLKGYHLELSKHLPQRDQEGWKVSDRDWEAVLENKYQKGEITRQELETCCLKGDELVKPPKTVTVGERFKTCIKALRQFLKETTPPIVAVRSKEVFMAVYGFVDASGTGFGSTLLDKGDVTYRIGTWSSAESDNSSNWREFENLVSEIEKLGEAGKLTGAQVILATDNQVVESALYKGNSTSEKLYELVVRLRVAEMKYSGQLFVTHVSGTRMMAQGTDGVSRGAMHSGVAVGQEMLRYCPWAKSAFETSPLLLQWIKSWAGKESELLEPEDWYTKGHDIVGGKIDREGQWQPVIKKGTYIWGPPPAAGDACLEELRKARMKRKESTHIVVIPKLATPLWLRQLNKAADFVFSIAATSDFPFWPSSSHESLYVALVLPYLPFRPWQIRQTPKSFYAGRHLSKVFSEPNVDAGSVLFKLYKEFGELPFLPRDVVWRVLYFGQDPPFPRRLPGEKRGSKRKRGSGGGNKDERDMERKSQRSI